MLGNLLGSNVGSILRSAGIVSNNYQNLQNIANQQQLNGCVQTPISFIPPGTIYKSYKIKLDKSFKDIDIKLYLEAASILNLECTYNTIVFECSDGEVKMTLEQMRQTSFSNDIEKLKNEE